MSALREGGEEVTDLHELHDRLTDCIIEAEQNGDDPEDQHATIMLPELLEWRDTVREATNS